MNPIVDWTDEEVWEFLNDIVKVPHCCLYDQGHHRIGCIGCPMSAAAAELERYPAFKKLYMRTFDRMLKARREAGLPTDWKDADDVMRWWLGKESEQKE